MTHFSCQPLQIAATTTATSAAAAAATTTQFHTATAVPEKWCELHPITTAAFW